MTNLHEHVRSQGDIHAQTCPLTSLPQGTLIEYIKVLEFGSNNRFATCQKSRIQDRAHPVEKNLAKTIPFIIRSNVVQQRIVINVHTALFRFHTQVTNCVTYSSSIRRIRKDLLVQNAIKYSQIKRE